MKNVLIWAAWLTVWTVVLAGLWLVSPYAYVAVLAFTMGWTVGSVSAMLRYVRSEFARTVRKEGR